MGRQWLGNIGKTDNGVVTVASLWADEGVYYPLEVEPYTPSHHFEGGKKDPEVSHQAEDSLAAGGAGSRVGIPFRAVVADSFYGEDRGFRRGLGGLGACHTYWP